MYIYLYFSKSWKSKFKKHPEYKILLFFNILMWISLLFIIILSLYLWYFFLKETNWIEYFKLKNEKNFQIWMISNLENLKTKYTISKKNKYWDITKLEKTSYIWKSLENIYIENTMFLFENKLINKITTNKLNKKLNLATKWLTNWLKNDKFFTESFREF